MSGIDLNLYFSDIELENLRKAKVEAEINDIDYLNKTPEVSRLLEAIYQNVLEEKPENVYDHILDYISKLEEIPK